ncbi:MAG: DUF3108 domain-containing protein [Candidatus Brocadiaceae bacterium]|jgi:hypothetical protein
MAPEHKRRTFTLTVLTLLAAVAALGWLVTRGQERPRAAGAGEALPPVGELPFDPPERLKFEFGWNGIRAATLTTEVTREGAPREGTLLFRYTAQTTPLLERVWEFRAEGHTVLEAATLRPLSARLETEEGEESKTVETRFDWGRRRATVQVVEFEDGQVERETVQREAAPDFPAALLLLRSVPIPPGGLSLRVLSEDDLYRVEVKPGAPETLQVAAGSFRARSYDVIVQKQEEDDEERTSRRLRAWLGGPGRMPVRMESRIVLGTVYVELLERADLPVGAYGDESERLAEPFVDLPFLIGGETGALPQGEQLLPQSGHALPQAAEEG